MALTIACVAGAESRGKKGREIIRKRKQRAYFSRILLSPGDCLACRSAGLPASHAALGKSLLLLKH